MRMSLEVEYESWFCGFTPWSFFPADSAFAAQHGYVHIELRRPPANRPQRRQYYLALTLTCKAIRQESFPAYFEANAFSFKPWVMQRYQDGHPVWVKGEAKGWSKHFLRWLTYVPKLGRTGMSGIDINLGSWQSSFLLHAHAYVHNPGASGFEYLTVQRMCESGLARLAEKCLANDMTLHVNIRVDCGVHVRVQLRLPILDKASSLAIVHAEFQRAVQGTVPVGTMRGAVIDMPIALMPGTLAEFESSKENVCQMLEAMQMRIQGPRSSQEAVRVA